MRDDSHAEKPRRTGANLVSLPPVDTRHDAELYPCDGVRDQKKNAGQYGEQRSVGENHGVRRGLCSGTGQEAAIPRSMTYTSITTSRNYARGCYISSHISDWKR